MADLATISGDVMYEDTEEIMVEIFPAEDETEEALVEEG